jgi:hypothetical protein
MKNKTMILLATIILSTGLAATYAGGQVALGVDGSKKNADSDTAIPLKEAKLIIEHNAKDEDTGFQGALDSEGWNTITVTGPDGKVLNFTGLGKLGELGLTELFFETVEPENADVPITELLKTLPEGEYVFEGSAIEAGVKQGQTIGTALLTHDIPEGPELLLPAENATVPEDSDLLVSWGPVDKTIDGSDINIIAYQLIIEKDEDPHPHMIGKMGLSMYLPPDVNEMTIPSEFLEPDTKYLWEVLAIEESGNQALNSSQFSTSTVLAPVQGIQKLKSFVSGLHDVSSSTKGVINARLDAALAYLTDGGNTANDGGACTQLDGFIRAANTYVGADKLSTQQTQQIIQTLPDSAQALRTSLGCT